MILTVFTIGLVVQITDVVSQTLRDAGYDYTAHRTTAAIGGGTIWDYEYKNQSLGSRVSIGISPSTPAGAAARMRSFDRFSQRDLPDKGSFHRMVSGLPLGIHLRADSGSGTVLVLAYGDVSGVDVNLFSRASKAHGTTVWEQFDPERDKALCEGVARWALAAETAKRYAQGTTSIGGRSYSSRKSPKGALLVKARDWGSANGYTLSLNKPMGRAQITGPRGTILIPLGADRVKVNDRWVQFDGIVGAIGEEPLLPVAAIQDLVNGG